VAWAFRPCATPQVFEVTMNQKSLFECATEKELSVLIGIKPPKSFLDFVSSTQILFADNLEEAGCFTDETMFFRPYPECHYPNTPFELIPFGDLGVDGAHYGFVVHAPELNSIEYPIGVFNPLDSTFGMVGTNTRDFLERKIASTQIYWRKTGKDAELFAESKQRFKQKLDQLVERLRLKPTHGRALDGDAWIKEGVVPANVPAGWLHKKSRDGIGVLAPKKFFDSKVKDEATAAEYMRHGYPASALFSLRETLFKEGANPEIFEAMANAYDVLGREMFAKLARMRAKDV
jgi:hypothetical protein